MRSEPALHTRLRPHRSLVGVGAIALAALFVLSGLAGGPSAARAGSSASAASAPTGPSSELAAAGRSLSLGLGPADGAPIRCSLSGASTGRCLAAPSARGGAGPLPSNSSLQVHASATPTGGTEPLTVHFVANATGGVAPYHFTWDPGDGSANATGAYFNHTYSKKGAYDATLLGNDSANGSARAEVTITVGIDSWYDLPSSQTQPPWSYEASMTYDPQIGGILLFGGSEEVSPYTISDQTWEYTGGVWKNISASLPTSPSARYGAGLVYDVNDSYALLFGGYSTSCGTSSYYYYYYDYCNDTWTFTPTEGWSQIYPTDSPEARFNFAMADDPADGYVVLFGGTCYGCNGYYYNGQADDTWIFHDGQWTDWTANTTKSPGAVRFTAAVYDSAAGYVLMYGGAYNCESGTTTQTWTFARGNWSELTISSQPPGDYGGSLAYDSALGEGVYFGGTEANCAKTYDETWTFGNGTWTDVTSTTSGAPTSDSETAMAYDPAVGAAIYLGNNGQLNGSKKLQSVWTWPGPPLITTPSISPAEGIAPFNVTFSASTTGGTSPYNYTWAFGDGTPNATGNNLTHEYAVPGNYSVTLTTNDSTGRVAILGLRVLGYGSLLAYPTTTALVGEAPWTVHFYSNATGGVPPLTRLWSFGDGTSSTAAAAVHTYSAAGNYTATLTLKDGGGHTENWSFPVEAVAKLIAAPTDTPAVGQAPLTVDFAAGGSGGLGPFAYNWSFGDGSPNSTSADPSHTYAEPGAYGVQIQIVDSLHDVAITTLTVTVTVPLVAVPTATPTQGLGPLTVTFTDASTGGSLPYTISWNFGDGSTPMSGNVVEHTYASAGTYTATESVTDEVGTVAQQAIGISVVTPLSATLTANTTLAAEPASVGFVVQTSHGEGPFTYSYRFGDGGTATGSAWANHTFTGTGTFEVRATVTDALHESVTSDLNVTVVAPLVAQLTVNSQTVPVGGTLNLSAGSTGGEGPYAYAWSGLPDGCASSGTSTITCQPTVARNYTVSVTISDRAHENRTASTWVLVTAASSGSGGAGAGSLLSGSSWIYVLLAVIVVAAIAFVALRRRRSPPTDVEPSEAPGEEISPGETDGVYEAPPES
jgi:PKD repeat protein